MTRVAPTALPQLSPAHALMNVTIGYWASQAVYVAAKLGIPDQLGDSGLDPADLARLTGSDPVALRRLLRLLAQVDVVRQAADGTYHNTELGTLLRTEEHGSMRDLALLYGEEFYAGWGNLLHTVRTGENGFQALNGAAMYPYFQQSPELTSKFDRAMAAGSEYFRELSSVHDFHAAKVLVDIGGGNGALLLELLSRHPGLHGILFDAPHVIDAAESELRGTEFADRLEFAAGDYRQGVPTGHDTYMLSRILHGRDDAKCLDLLAIVRDAIDEDGTLLIIERVIASDDEPSLAVWFDVHMLAIAGGEERTESQYRSLLSEAGFELTASHPLPLDFELIVARPRVRSTRG